MRYFIYGYYGFGNFGDDLMLAAIVHQIKLRDADAQFMVKCRSPVEGLGPAVEFLTADIIWESLQPTWRRGLRYLGALFRGLRGHDWFVIGGGALFLDKGAVNKSLILLWCLVLRARLMGVRIAVIGVSCDLLADPMSLWLTRSIFRGAAVITVRDHFSYDYARYFGRRDTRLCADLVFASPQFTQDSIAGIQRRRASRVGSRVKPRIGVCLVDYFAVYEPDAARREVFMDRMTESLLKHSAEAEYVYISLQENQGLGDDRVYAVLAGRLAFADYRSVGTLAQATDLCGELDGILTMRYHLGLLAAASGLPVVALHHELKLVSIALMPGVMPVGLSQLIKDDSADPIGLLMAAAAGVPAHEQPDAGTVRHEAMANFSWLD